VNSDNLEQYFRWNKTVETVSLASRLINLNGLLGDIYTTFSRKLLWELTGCRNDF